MEVLRRGTGTDLRTDYDPACGADKGLQACGGYHGGSGASFGIDDRYECRKNAERESGGCHCGDNMSGAVLRSDFINFEIHSCGPGEESVYVTDEKVLSAVCASDGEEVIVKREEVSGMELEKLSPDEMAEINRKYDGDKLYLWRYQNMLEAKAAEWLENYYEVVDMEEVWQRTVDSHMIWGEKPENEILAFDCFRKYVLELVRSGKATPKASCTYLQEYIKRPGEGPNELHEHSLKGILSLFERKQFDYFINRYYFMDSDVKYNRRLEFQIARLFLGLGTGRFVLLWEGIKYLKPGTSRYVGYLDSIPTHFLGQIGKKGELQWHWDMKSSLRMEMKYRTRKFGYVMYLVVLPVMMIVMYFIYMSRWR